MDEENQGAGVESLWGPGVPIGPSRLIALDSLGPMHVRVRCGTCGWVVIWVEGDGERACPCGAGGVRPKGKWIEMRGQGVVTIWED